MLLIAFVMGPPGHRKMRPPGPIPGPALLNSLGPGMFFLGFLTFTPYPTHSPDGPPLPIGGKKRGPV